MVKRLKHKVLITPQEVKPTREDFKVIGIFNPAAIRFGDEIYLLARVAETFAGEKEDFFFSPRYVFKDDRSWIEIDSFPIKSLHNGDTRVYVDGDGFARLPFISHLRLIKLEPSGFDVTYVDEKQTFYPENSYEEFGVEDPRLTFLDNRYYFTYVAVSRESGVATALASTVDFKSYERHGIIFCQENKDVVILPEKFNGNYCAYHRPVGRHGFSNPNIHAAFSPDLIHWGKHRLLMGTRRNMWDSKRLGAGTVPIKTSKSWFEIYHGVKLEEPGNSVGVYRAGAALFDLEDPTRLIARSKEPVLSPETPHETEGFVNNVIFPTGAVPDMSGENVILYSGGADTVITATLLSLQDIFDSLI